MCYLGKKTFNPGRGRLATARIIVFSLILALPSAAIADLGSAVSFLNAVMDRYHALTSNDIRFLESYPSLENSSAEKNLEDAAFVYDNALALLSYLKQNSPDGRRRAAVLANSFVYAATHDRYYHDGRLRNAYSAKRLINPNDGIATLPGYWDVASRQWHEEKDQISTHTGNMAWAAIALSQFYAACGGDSYKAAAVTIGKWIYDNTFDAKGGYTGGYAGWEPHAEKLLWKSTEHNIDVYACFLWLQKITGDKVWEERAQHARRFVDAMWAGDHFWIGTTPEGNVIDKDHPALDVQAWAILALGDFKLGLQWAEQYCYAERDGFKGFDFNTDKDGIWFEGTAQMVLAYKAAGEAGKADLYLGELRRAQTSAKNSDGKGIVAASHDRVSTGLGGYYSSRLHIGATAWYIFAELGYNPYSGNR